MIEEEKKAIETIENFIKDYKYNEQTSKRANLDVLREECQAIEFMLNKYDVTQKELNNLKEIEKSHKEENEKLRIELEQYKLLEANIDKANKIIAENKFDEGLYGLLMQEKEKNKELEKYKTYYEEMEEVNKKFIAVDKIKEKIRMYKLVGNSVSARALELLLEEN